jgi:hypothetical protein
MNKNKVLSNLKASGIFIVGVLVLPFTFGALLGKGCTWLVKKIQTA